MLNTHLYMQLQVQCDSKAEVPTVSVSATVVKLWTITPWFMGSGNWSLRQWSTISYSQTREVGQFNAAILTVRREHSSCKFLELVWEIFLVTFGINEGETRWVLWLCSTMLNFDSNGFFKLVGTCYPVDTTNKFCIFCKMELSRERCFDMNMTLIYFKRKSIFWKM